MSDVFPGPGWWLASDGKWYEPEVHPEAAYRDRFDVEYKSPTDVGEDAAATRDITYFTLPADVAVKEVVDDDIANDVATTDDDDLNDEELVAPIVGAAAQAEAFDRARRERLAEAQRSAEALRDAGIVEPPRRVRLTEKVKTDENSPLDLRGTPRGDNSPGEAIPTDTASEGSHQVEGRTKLELRSEADQEVVASPDKELFEGPAWEIAPGAVAKFERTEERALPPDVADRLLFGILFFAGLALVLGTFLEWTTGPAITIGVDRVDGIVVLISGVVASITAVLLFIGFQSVLTRAAALISGLVGLTVIGVLAVNTLTEMERTGLSLGMGFYVVLVGSLAVIVAAGASSSNPTG